MDPEKTSEVFKLKQGYWATLDLIDEQNVSLHIMDYEGGCQYRTGKCHQLSMIRSASLLKAFKHQANFSYELIKPEGEANLLVVKIKVAPTYLMPIQECLSLTFFKKITQLDLMQVQMQDMAEKLKNISTRVITAVYIDEKKQSGNFDQFGNDLGMDYDEEACDEFTQFTRIALGEPGRYLVTISFFAKSPNNYFYLYEDKNYQSKIAGASGVLGLPSLNHMTPFSLTVLVDTRSSGLKHKIFYGYNSFQQPYTAKNIVVSALKLCE